MFFKSLLFLLLVMTNAVYAVQCPKVVTGTTFVHQNSPAIQSTPWLMDNTYVTQGWSITSDPLAESSMIKTISADSLMTVLIAKSSTATTNQFYVSCRYMVEKGSRPIYLNVVFISPHAAPINSNFQKIDENTYACTTKADRPENCSDSDVRPVNCGIGMDC